MRPFVSVDETRALDRATTDKLRMTSFELMQKVARGMAEIFQQDPRLLSGSILILCGPGNNGGDGYCLAENLRQQGRDVSVFDLHPPKSEDCIRARKEFRGAFSAQLAKTDIVVDAIYGSSGRSDLAEAEVRVFKEVNRRSSFKVALDSPSGVDSRSGRLHANTFRADISLVVGWPKTSFLSEEVAEVLGQINYIGDYFENPQDAKLFVIEKSDFRLPPRKRTGFKNLYGRCGVVGGSASMPGAALLAAEAAHRFGSGYATVFFAKPGVLKLKIKDASFLLKTRWKVSELNRESALVLGCGGFLKKFSWKNISRPMVIDADALSDFKKFKGLRAPAILTPHPGEAGRMLKITTAKVQSDRLAALREISKMTNQSVYLKGAPGLLRFCGENKTYVNLSINPVFSKAGSGDILAGLMGSALAQAGGEAGDGGDRGRDESGLSDGFKRAILNALVFQAEVGERLRGQEASIAFDQLRVFSDAFRELRRRG